MPNTFATFMLAFWPLATLAIFRYTAPGRAVVISLLLAYLFLPPQPAAFDFPLMPPLHKENLPSLAAFAAALIFHRGQIRILPDNLVVRGLMLVFVLSPFATVLTNSEPVFYGRVGLPALRLIEAVALMVQQSMLLLPFVLAWNFLRNDTSQRDILLALFWGGLAYSILMLIEIRMSPQLNLWVYGYFQHYFAQSIRFGGYRPVVFLYHGLWVAFFAMTALIAAVALLRVETGRRKVWYFFSTGYMAAILVLSKSLGSILYGMFLAPLVLLVSRRIQLMVALLAALVAFSYPILKGADMIPEKALLERAAGIDPERAASLQFRFDNERTLLDRAYLKPVFGWGSWGRNHELDPVSGRILTVTDGRWVITIGVFGWVGYLAEYGLLCFPVLMAWWRSRFMEKGTLPPYGSALTLLLAINIVDLIPNATITPLTWLMAGAVLGYAETGMQPNRKKPETLRSIM